MRFNHWFLAPAQYLVVGLALNSAVNLVTDSSSVQAAKTVHSLEQMANSLRDPILIKHREQLSKQLQLISSDSKSASDSAEQLVQMVKDWQMDGQLSELQKEHLLHEFTLEVRALKQIHAVAPIREQLQQLTKHQSEQYFTMPDGGHQLQLPAYQIASSARAALLHLEMLETHGQLSKLIDNPDAFTQILLNNSQAKLLKTNLSNYQQAQQTAKAHQIAAINIIRDLDDKTLKQLNDFVNQEQLLLPVNVHQALAEQSASLESYQLFATASKAHNNIIYLAQSLMDLPLSEAEQIELLNRVIADGQLTNLAISKLAPMVDSQQAVRTQLLDIVRTNQEHGAAAAKALSASSDANLLSELASMLDANSDVADFAKSRALLALHLNGSEQASSYLQSFALDKSNQQRYPELVKAVQQWIQ